MLKKTARLRSRRFLFKVGTSDVKYHQSADRGGTMHFSVGDSAIQKPVDSPVQVAFKTASKVIARSGDIITAPALWLKDIQKNWLIYMIIVVIILLSVLILYCAFHYYFARKGNNPWSAMDLVRFVTTFGNKNGMPQGQPPVPLTNLSSAAPALIGDFKF